MKEAVIVACGRSAIGKAPKGALKSTRPEWLGAQVLRGVLARTPSLDSSLIDDLIVGCAFPESEQGMNIARMIGLRAELPESVPAQTVNRFCSSGLQSIALAANAIMAGQSEVIAAGGVECMSMVPIGGYLTAADPELMNIHPGAQATMGITAENLAARYGISREEQDAYALNSHHKAAKAQDEGRFEAQIIPVQAFNAATDANGFATSSTAVFDKDEGIRPGISMQALAKLRTVFKKDGSVTAGNASQTSDGAAFVLVMSAEKAAGLGLRPLARFRGFAAAGVDPAIMGIGPVKAIPKVLRLAGLSLKDIGLIELNEAFACQAIACIRELGLNPEITNVNGGAIALGHPLGCTGSLLTAKLLDEMKRRDCRYGLVSMCIGGGMGAAAVFERM